MGVVKALGITNQRETTIAWNKNTGFYLMMLLCGVIQEQKKFVIIFWQNIIMINISTKR